MERFCEETSLFFSSLEELHLPYCVGLPEFCIDFVLPIDHQESPLTHYNHIFHTVVTDISTLPYIVVKVCFI